MLALQNVSKSFGRSMVLQDVSFAISPGEFVCITGPSGAGKSTLLHLLAGVEQPSQGTVEIDGVNLRSVPPKALQIFRRRLGIVFQDYKLLPHLTVAENIAFPLEVCGIPEPVMKQRVFDLLNLMHLTGQANALPPSLSGGEKARTAIARAIAHGPLILLADEPTGNIDPEQSKMVMELFRSIHAQGTSVIIATHDSGLVDSLQTRVITIGNGHIVRDSVGGYTTAPAREHHVFQETPAAPEVTSVPITENGSDPEKRKVRITAINGS